MLILSVTLCVLIGLVNSKSYTEYIGDDEYFIDINEVDIKNVILRVNVKSEKVGNISILFHRSFYNKLIYTYFDNIMNDNNYIFVNDFANVYVNNRYNIANYRTVSINICHIKYPDDLWFKIKNGNWRIKELHFKSCQLWPQNEGGCYEDVSEMQNILKKIAENSIEKYGIKIIKHFGADI